MTDINDRYRLLAAELTRRVEAVPAERWGSPSPCEGWTARDVLRHLLDSHVSMPGYVGLTLASYPPVETAPAAAWAAVRDQMQAILDDPERAQLSYDGYFGRTTLQETVDTFLGFDLLVHTWDIARATGGDERLDPAQVRRVFADARALGDDLRAGGDFASEVPVADDADQQTKLLAFLGRRP